MGEPGLSRSVAGGVADERGWLVGLEQLDDEHFASYSVGQAAELLGVQQAFLRSLDAAEVVAPKRSDGGHRRYSRHQLGLAERVRDLFDQGHSMASAKRVLELEESLRQAHGERDSAREQRDQAHELRDQAREQRDEAYRQRDEAREQRDQAYQQRDEAREQRDEAYQRRDRT